MALTPQWLDELRMRTTLSAVISRTVRLTKAGREFKACCPFHNEKTPSFYVNDEKGFYHCFGCEAHGDAIRWLTDQRGMPFMDAVKELAAEAGMEVPAPDPRAAERAEKRASLHDVTAAAQQWFVDKLASSEGAEARSYLKRRGFSDAVVREFGFGFAPAERQALAAALPFEESMLVESGMRIEVEGKDPYDRFRNRLMLPIQDTRGRVIAFGGRILDADAHGPKYLNSPDTPLFDKGRTLYNLHRAAPAARQSGRIVVVEGYMDAIALANAGIAEAVAPLGTALTENQIELLWRQVECPLLCFDGDNAGRRAAMRAITRALPLLGQNRSFAIVQMPKGLDPDDLIKNQGVEAFELLLAQPTKLIDFLWEFELQAKPLNTPEEKAGLKSRLLEHTSKIEDSLVRALYRREYNQRFDELVFGKRDRSNASFGKVIESGDRFQQKKAFDEVHWKARADHLYRRLGAAIVMGMILHPKYIRIYGSEFEGQRLKAYDPRIDILLESAEYDRDFSQEYLADVLVKRGRRMPETFEWDDLNFPFTMWPQDDEEAHQSFRKAVTLYTRMPLVDDALRKATAEAGKDLTDGNWGEQQRLLAYAMQLREELLTMMAA
ncbi:DNA primase [Qipengyuania sphaerica]|uniref:DNA primase n=1 Tax=Qipengyuania sphaerica TaxID=2867243 RepID=UPI001C87E19A|nr:DNA primase [Qipengyuania sphaerica]MBX7540786.1 DNA primase [Qipengyuania sphaerica]